MSLHPYVFVKCWFIFPRVDKTISFRHFLKSLCKCNFVQPGIWICIFLDMICHELIPPWPHPVCVVPISTLNLCRIEKHRQCKSRNSCTRIQRHTNISSNMLRDNSDKHEDSQKNAFYGNKNGLRNCMIWF